ncbi:MAG: aldehyde dehydrogenase (NADP(+)) [Specibacter sp.]
MNNSAVVTAPALPPSAAASRVDAAVGLACAAARQLAETTREERSRWLGALADALDRSISGLVACAREETNLGEARLRGEVGRTSGQLRLFAEVLTEGSYLEATIDHADTTTVPPRPDLRRMLLPLGPVAVYAASNFPFAFSVLGGDTAAALAAGSPVVVKAHPGHPRLSRLVAALAEETLSTAGAPDGLLTMVEGFDAGIELVQHPRIAAAAFTGSVRGGRALFDLAAARPVPIPFFGELGSLNPVVITVAGLREHAVELAEGLCASFTLGVGQFCTKPGLVIVPAGSGFEDIVRLAMQHASGGTMLTGAMQRQHAADMGTATALTGVSHWGPAGPHGTVEPPAILSTDAGTLLEHPGELLAEHFGPSTVLVGYRSITELNQVLDALPGSLTATIHAGEDEEVGELVEALRPNAGRLLFGGWPTGVQVSWAQHHGGPYPAATSQFTSVGAGAIRRFLRPIAYQGAPERVLPQELRDGEGSIPRRINGVLVVPAGA